jgi:hypothetical protein
MDRKEYEQELKHLYRTACNQENVAIALDILERGRSLGLSDIRGPLVVPETLMD